MARAAAIVAVASCWLSLGAGFLLPSDLARVSREAEELARHTPRRDHQQLALAPPVMDGNLQYEGRWTPKNDPNGGCGWSGCSVSALITGTKNVYFVVEEQGSNFYEARITSGGQTVTKVFGANKNQTRYLLADTLNPADQYLVFVGRRTEGFEGTTNFLAFAFDQGGHTLPITTPQPSRLLEFIGDSITCGYGNEGKEGCHFTPDTENHFLAWGPVLASRLDARFTTIAWSGKGVVRNYGDKNKTSVDPMPIYYNRTLATTPVPLWDFSTLIPDAVLINLGTNDFSTQPTPDPDVFIAGYLALSQRAQAHYPRAKQFFVCGPMIGNPCCQYVQQASQKAGATYVDLMNILTPPADIGCDGHPSVSGHAKMADHAEPVVRKVMGW
eukprot:TRINITY_DN7965_c0_g1_i2.p2 TRINITY_DN7965_c0_g1~~TRINITY_DN7965_c0_g1_i2.p2  ORF type:complete len:385 (-),score=61.30 TRINITY_DN7965_c0_g1_i2:335-1489(-)